MGARRAVAVGVVGVGLAAVAVGFVATREGAASQSEAAAKQPAAARPFVPHDVVVVWAGGAPDARPAPPVEEGPVDAITHATPRSGNVREVAEKLGKVLEASGRSVLVIPADECRDPRHFTHAKAVVVGCPSYFGLPPWQMIRVFQEPLYRVYRTPGGMGARVLTAFSTTQGCLDVLTRLLKATEGTVVEGAVITPRRATAARRDALIRELAGRVTDKL